MGALNVKTRKIRLVFDEDIQQKNLQQQLIISPLGEMRFKTKLNREVLELELDQDLEPNTTYTFNFGNTIGDITENNPAENLVLAFSTGNVIDSLSLSGNVYQLLSSKPAEKAIVGLYPEYDTANILTRKPYYLTRTDEAGNYEFQYLKPGRYFIYAGADANQNLMIESRSEAYGFLAEPLSLSSPIDSVRIPLVGINADSLKLNSARPNGRYYELTYNKPIAEYTISADSSLLEEIPANNLVEENKTIRFYARGEYGDSLNVRIIAQDSLGQQLESPVAISFQESTRAAAPFTVVASPESGATLKESFRFMLSFSKPVDKFEEELFYIAYDSTNRRAIVLDSLAWNKRRDGLQIDLQVPKPNYPDSIAAGDRPNNFMIVLEKGAAISAEQDTLAEQQYSYSWLDTEKTGHVSGEILTDSAEGLIIELYPEGKSEPLVTLYGTKYFRYRQLPPANYTMRIIRDSNGNRRWDAGNIHEKREPEPVYNVPTPITVKANWEIEDVEISLPDGV